MPQNPAEDREFLAFGLLGVCLTVALALLHFMGARDGVGISADSMAYLDAARNFAAGRGLAHFNEGRMEVLTQWPPLYPLVLSVAYAIGLSPDVFIPVLNLLLFFVLIFAVGWATAGFLKSSYAGILAGLMTALSVETLRIFSMAWSEPLFVTLTFLSLWFWSKYLRDASLNSLFVCGLLVSAAFLTRYPGIVLIGCIGLSLLLQRHASWVLKFKHLAYFLAVGVIPGLLWMVRNKRLSGETLQVEVSYHPEAWMNLQDIGGIILSWFVPYRLYGLALAVMTGVILYFLMFRRKSLFGSVKAFLSDSFWGMACFWSLAYVAFLLATALFLKEIDFDFRMLFPVRLVVVPIVVALGWKMFSAIGSIWGKRIGVALLVIWVVFSVTKILAFAVSMSREPAYYSLNRLKASALMRWVAALPPDAVVYSNASTIVHHFTRRETLPLPRRMIPVERLVNPDYENDLKRMEEHVRASQGYIVYFSDVNWRGHLVSEAELKDLYPLRLIHSSAEGSVYQLN